MYEELVDKIAEYTSERKKRGLKSFVGYGSIIFNVETGEPIDSYFASAVYDAYPELDEFDNKVQFKIWKKYHHADYPTPLYLPSYRRLVLDYQGVLKRSLQTLKDKYILYTTNETKTTREIIASMRKRKYEKPLVVLIDILKPLKRRPRGSRGIRIIYRIADPKVLKSMDIGNFAYEMPHVTDVNAFVERHGPSVALQVASRT